MTRLANVLTPANSVTIAFWVIAVVPAVTLPVTDPDTWWHIRAGREVLGGGAIPTVDTWSIAGEGRAWVTQDWLSNVLLAIGYGVGSWGTTLLSVAYGLVGVVAIGVLWNAIGVRQPSIGWLARPAWLLFGLVLAAPVVGVRVQVVDLLLAAAVLNVLWRYVESRQRMLLITLPVIALAWVNLHAGFPLLFLIGGAVLVGEAVDRWLRRMDGRALNWSQLGWLALALLASAVALMANPNGWKIYAYPFDTLGISVLGSFIGEWQPARFDAPAGQLLGLFIVAGILPTLLAARQRLRASDALILLGLTYMAITAVRFLLIAGPIGAAIVCAVLAPTISASRYGRRSARLLERFVMPRRGAGRVASGLLAVAVLLVGLAVATLRIVPSSQATAIAEVYPVAAVDWLTTHDAGERIFNRYEWGGYLGLEMPEHPIFIDGRADVYGDEVVREYVETISVTGNPQQTFDRYRIDHILYPSHSTLGEWITKSDGWEQVYADDVASIWVSR